MRRALEVGLQTREGESRMGQLALTLSKLLIEHPVMRFETGVELVDLLLNRASSGVTRLTSRTAPARCI